MRTWTLVLFAAVLAGGCAALTARPSADARGRRVERLAGAVHVKVGSEVPNPYTVFSGPVETYRRYRFNDSAAARFEAYGRAKSGAGGDGVDVVVTLRSLDTGYREVGMREAPRGVQVAFAGSRFPGALGRIAGDESDFSIPNEIHRSATLSGLVEVGRGGAVLARKEFTAQVSNVVYWQDYSRWVYDYTDVFAAVLEEAVTQVDRIVDDALGVARPPDPAR